MKKSLFGLIPLFVLGACYFPVVVEGESGDDFAMPAVTQGDNIIHYDAYSVCYNQKTLIPDWTAYELTADETSGSQPRQEGFEQDPDLVGPQADNRDYTRSGYDRGHMTPAGDMKWDEQAMKECFYFTNACPQNHTLNKYSWNYLEQAVRDWADEFGRVWVVTGPIIGENVNGTVGKGHVVVPDAFFKAVLVSKEGSYHAIAFVMENSGKRQPWRDCSVSINTLEEILGFDLYPALPDDVEELIEEQNDPLFWPDLYRENKYED